MPHQPGDRVLVTIPDYESRTYKEMYHDGEYVTIIKHSPADPKTGRVHHYLARVEGKRDTKVYLVNELAPDAEIQIEIN